MLIKGLIDEDFVNYKKASMFIAFPHCTFKCEKECGIACCQNSSLAMADDIIIDSRVIVERYINNPITQAIVFGGLEPFDSLIYVYDLVALFRNETDDDIVIYTGYNENEIEKPIKVLSDYENIIVKFGRFIPNFKPKYDELLGINLQSDNQYAKKISKVKNENRTKSEQRASGEDKTTAQGE